MNREFHWSDCPVNDEPAYPAGVCDCTQAEPRDLEDDLANPDVYKVGLVRALIQEARQTEALKLKRLLEEKQERINNSLFKIVMFDSEWEGFWQVYK
jgi:hypothetical protein